MVIRSRGSQGHRPAACRTSTCQKVAPQQSGPMTEILTSQIVSNIWWQWNSENPSAFDIFYHGFNIAESFVWLCLAGLVLRRFLETQNSRMELAYALLLATFGITDVVEAWEQSTWLFALKGMNLLMLLWIRRSVMKRYYPASGLY